MADLNTISSILSRIKVATDLARLIKDRDVSLEKAETKLQLAESISALADAKIETANVLLIIRRRAHRLNPDAAGDLPAAGGRSLHVPGRRAAAHQ
jgi:hypothetical protein